MKYTQSIIQQKTKGTYERNQQIIKIYQGGIIINMAELGRIYKISRQAVRAIIRREVDGKPKPL